MGRLLGVMSFFESALPRAWVESIAQLRRDAATVARGLAGRAPSPLIARPPANYVDDGARAYGTLLAPRTLRIARVVRETADAVSLVLEDPTGGEIAFRPGQFLTLLVTIDGEPLRRAYSIASDCRDPSQVTIAVKRVAGGRVSSHVCDAFAEGQSVEVLGPSGSFGITPSPTSSRHVLLLAGGSGITPMMAIARAVLALEPMSRVTLLYGNRAEADVLFAAALAGLARAYADRFTLRHVLEDPREGWLGGRGRLTRDVVQSELAALGVGDDVEALVCGPEAMMREARAALVLRGLSAERIMEERFASPHLRAEHATARDGQPQILTLRDRRGDRSIAVAPSQTILEAGLAAGLPMPYSCAMGGCAACKVKLCEGDVTMEEPSCLTAEERAQGYVLACVSRLNGAATIALSDAAGEAS
jgi:ring-1,2-phenylacetyl-CoA epoxidase subunit PaaE